MKRLLLKLAGVGLVLGLVGALGAASGIVPIRASSGHWALTSWFLHFAMRRSVRTQSAPIRAPEPAQLDDAALVLKGAGHYEIGCRPCHGSPSLPSPRLPAAMTPPPPALSQAAARWDAAELFYIVKHGVKFTGMPAWPAQRRDDEVWAVVAFLRALRGLDAQGYRKLIDGEAPSPGAAACATAFHAETANVPLCAALQGCIRCHGADGLGRGLSSFPKLAGQSPVYLAASLEAYARGARASGIMEPIAAELHPEQIQAIARYYGTRTAPVPPAPRPESLATSIARGARIAQHGLPAQRVPACAACHGPSVHPHSSLYPHLSGQYEGYLVLQLELFQRGDGGGTAYAPLMRRAARGLTREQVRDLARYYASLPPD